MKTLFYHLLFQISTDCIRLCFFSLEFYVKEWHVIFCSARQKSLSPYICLCVCMYVLKYVCIHVHVCVYTYVCMYVYTYVCIHVCMHACNVLYTCMCAYMYVLCMHTCMSGVTKLGVLMFILLPVGVFICFSSSFVFSTY